MPIIMLLHVNDGSHTNLNIADALTTIKYTLRMPIPMLQILGLKTELLNLTLELLSSTANP
jgi:hypothetical protein